MSSILNMNRVNYECGCGEWWPLCNLYFCRHCSSLRLDYFIYTTLRILSLLNGFRCQSCSLSEIDSTFCPNCLENIPAGEARLKRNRCVNCNQCPICAMVVSTRAVGDSCHLMCSTCRWSTRDSDTPDQNTSVNWPIDQIKMNKRQMYQKRKKTFEKPTPQAPVHEASAEVPELDINSLMNLVAHDIPSLDSRIRQPLAAGRTLRPVRMPLSARKAIRCKQCDHNLIKLEYGTCTIRYKIQYFARNFVPELRLSRETQLTAGEIGSVLLTIANESSAKTDVRQVFQLLMIYLLFFNL
uniref:Dynactin subunit 4 n=1 Tax=Heterorhabditis bacteriophora TaxID=37862 RepID=A0A1I7XFY0_HETBA